MVNLRPLQPRDIDALYAISLATGLAGDDASSLYRDRKLMGHIYSAPYASLQPDLCLVAEDAAGVAGFVVGAADTFAWEARLEREWWPRLREQYPAPDRARMAEWSDDQRRVAMIHDPKPVPAIIVQSYLPIFTSICCRACRGEAPGPGCSLRGLPSPPPEGSAPCMSA